MLDSSGDAAWYGALALAERSIPDRPPAPPDAADLPPATRRLARWQAQPPFDDEAVWAQRLTHAGLSVDTLLALLAEQPPALAARLTSPPAWLATLADALAQPTVPDSLPLTDALREQPLARCLALVEPLVEQARTRLQAGLAQLASSQTTLPFDPTTIEGILLEPLPKRLLRIIGRMAVLELNVARMQGRLQGADSTERFDQFVTCLHDPDQRRLLWGEYPLAARSVAEALDHWVVTSLELLKRLCADWDVIRTHFALASPGVLVAVEPVGDPHRGGRSVHLLHFASGERIVYKPRSLVVEQHFQGLLGWLNERGAEPPFRLIDVLDRGSYGWVEYIAARDCTAAAEVERFYRRQGAYLALLYALEATDMHVQNIIAAGEYPLLIDLESLFQPYASGLDPRPNDLSISTALQNSVLRIGLLPTGGNYRANDGVDLSGLGAAAGQVVATPSVEWQAVGTDQMHLGWRHIRTERQPNQPVLNGAQVDLLQYVGAIGHGFTGMYYLLLKHRSELLGPHSPLEGFRAAEIRVILRNTRTYDLLRHAMFHPDLLRGGLDRDRLLDRLWLGVVHRPELTAVLDAERHDLWQDDVPLFTTRSASRDLWTGQGSPIPDFFAASGYELARRRLEQLSPADLIRQHWMLRAALATLASATSPTQSPVVPTPTTSRSATPAQLIGAACTIGDRLIALARNNDDQWVGLALDADERWAIRPLGLNLYDGLPGIALFLAQLGDTANESRYTAMAASTLATIRQQLATNPPTQIGAFTGWGGLIYTWTRLGRLWQQPALLSEAEGMVEQVAALLDQDGVYDLIGGAAGAIGALLALNLEHPNERTLRVAIACGDWLLEHAQTMESGLGWPVLAGTTHFPPLTGFAHGGAGFAWALGRLAAASQEPRFRMAAQAALAYERRYFVAAAGNWADLRHAQDTTPRVMTAWCHGAPGIGMARLGLLPELADQVIHAEIETSIRTTLADSFGSSHSLCHGDLGNLDLLLQAQLYGIELGQQIATRVAALLAHGEQAGWHCATPLQVETPDLMLGLAGIGYGLLRLAAPTRVPSVLTLATEGSCESRGGHDGRRWE